MQESQPGSLVNTMMRSSNLDTTTILTEQLYVHALKITAAIEVVLFQFVGNRRPGLLLLKDCLGCPKLLSALPADVVHMCNRLFLPAGVNIRNLLW